MPPTEEATKYDSYRGYQQVQAWRGKEINPIDWGWIVSNNIFLPKTTDLPPAPHKLRKIMYCSCSKDSSSQKCPCKKNGIPCTRACNRCQITVCNNQQSIADEIAFEDDIQDELIENQLPLCTIITDFLDN